MVIHLESGNCASGMIRDELDMSVFDHYEGDDFTNDWYDHKRYRCPVATPTFRM